MLGIVAFGCVRCICPLAPPENRGRARAYYSLLPPEFSAKLTVAKSTTNLTTLPNHCQTLLPIRPLTGLAENIYKRLYERESKGSMGKEDIYKVARALSHDPSRARHELKDCPSTLPTNTTFSTSNHPKILQGKSS